MKRFVLIVLLAGCGADGEPIRPTEPQVYTMLNAGLSNGTVTTGVNVGVSTTVGNVKIGIGAGI